MVLCLRESSAFSSSFPRSNKTLVAAKKFLQGTYGICVHFSSIHANYFMAWSYVTKNYTRHEESERHPDHTNARQPRTMKAHESVQKTCKFRLRSKLGTSSNAVHIIDDHVSETTNVDKAKQGGPRKRQRLSA